MCLPGIFIRDDGGDEGRSIGVTFRLKDHPDVTIFFLDDKASLSDPKMTSKQKNQFVWQWEYPMGKKVKLKGLIPYRSAAMDGREGVATLGEITTFTGDTDYGYLVTVQGDVHAASDTPNLLLLVKRDSHNANGHPPISPEELEKMGESIAASVHRR